MTAHPANRSLLIVLVATCLLFLLGRLFGSALFDNSWSFEHWQYISIWYILGWFLAGILLVAAFHRYKRRIADFFDTPARVGLGLGLLLVLCWLFQYDSFLYGGGNIRVAQVAQHEDIIYRWFEYGSILIVSVLDSFYDLFGLHYNTAGVYAWKTWTFICTMLTIWGALHLARSLATERMHRLVLFLLVAAGPYLLLLFGFVGPAPAIVTCTIWLTYLTVRYLAGFSVARLLLLWLVLIVGIVFHVSIVYLLPGVVFVTSYGLFRRRKNLRLVVPFLAAVVTWGGLLVWVYAAAADNLELQKYLLFLSGKNPHSDYGLFSLRHIGDIVQLIFLVFPLVLVMKFLLLRDLKASFTDPLSLAAMLMALAGFTVVFIGDPRHGIVLDVPRLVAWLTPGALLLAVLVSRRLKREPPSLKPCTAGVVAAVAMVLPLAVLPSYLSIDAAEKHVEAYFDRHEAYWRTGAVALRDAYFYNKNWDRAGYWDQRYLVKSQDYLIYHGSNELAVSGINADALRSLTLLIARVPYWAAPRALYAEIQMNLQRYHLAKPQIDTALMLEPYDQRHHMNLYRYYRETSRPVQALQTVRRAASLFPSNLEIKTDHMLINYRTGHVAVADSLAHELLQIDSTLPYPYLVQGYLTERRGALTEAVSYYDTFLNLAPPDPDTTVIRQRRDTLLHLLENAGR